MSQWDKLLNKILNLSNDLKFNDLKRFLKSMVTLCLRLMVAAATQLLEEKGTYQLLFLDMTQLKKFM